MNDLHWLTLCLWSEARGEPADGKAAVARVVLNRTRRRWFSDGTVRGTVLARDQFSDFWFAMADGRYRRVCCTPQQAEKRAGLLLCEASREEAAWDACEAAASAVMAGTYASPAYAALTDDTLLYANLALCSPGWATPDKRVTTIGRHSFFRG